MMIVTPLAGPADYVKLERITALQNAARMAGLHSGWVSEQERAKPHLAVIADAMNEALDEINRCSRESEGTIDADPWFHVLHWQALLASQWVSSAHAKTARAYVWNSVFSRDT